MSFSFVIIDKKNSLDIININEYLKQNYLDYEILYCSTKAIQIQNIQNFVIIDDEWFDFKSLFACEKIIKTSFYTGSLNLSQVKNFLKSLLFMQDKNM